MVQLTSLVILATACCLQGGHALQIPASGDEVVKRNESGSDVTPHQIAASINAMNKAWYNETDGRWNSTTAWWLTGNALQSVCDYMFTTKDNQYLSLVEGTTQKQSGPLAWWPEGGGDFRADSTDDTGWWALAMVRLYDITANSTYLEYAKLDEAYIYSYWNSTCGGGVIWDIPELTYKNAISNELYMKLAASLHNRVPGDTQYLSRALEAWNWFNQSGMINSQNLINDGLTDDCVNNNETEWTYNQGVILGALSELYLATEDSAYIDAATTIADAVIASDILSPDGILTEYGCEPEDDCDENEQAFKGIFTRNLAELNVLIADKPYSSYLAENAQSAWTNDRSGRSDLFGISWAGPYSPASVGTQASVISLLVANIWQ
ncbi:family 76 glycoside hydrolase [Cryphonectria parasitica EP155]|uniref:Family 76 glycoside hydrolase n=1 Tax=Cryphonectria parasitica (strain ATCC 38755 / EP155) TaxID=660469 RepID=A0A9P5CQ65_CRYP1|nr:family 76 glycoside hydrolase [Cryphonectria parasitica EP155]KAF3767194.1 family 76 glycoside hydrolase [Cryphonectria parasitica EP155]